MRRLSVVIPCHNAAPYLAQTLGSLVEQRRRPDEVIVVDDGSTDESLAIALRFQAALPDLVRVRAERSGSAARTRNLGALEATGDALMFLDADDVIGPDTLGALEAALEQSPDDLAVCPWFRLVQEGDVWVRRPPSCAPRQAGDDPLAAWLRGWYHPPCSLLWPRGRFESVGRWDEQQTTNDDGDLVMRGLALGMSLVHADRGEGLYRRPPAGAVTLSGRRRTRPALIQRLLVLRKLVFILRERGRLNSYRPALADAYRQIASDAQDYPDLAGEAAQLALQYSGPRWNRIRARLLRWRGAPRRSSEAPRRNAASGGPVTWGLATAGALASVEPSRAIPRADLSIRRPAVSVVLPTFNRAGLLPRAVDSVLAQSFSDFELLVVDDGSTDDTPRVLAGYGDPRVRVLRQPRNAGVAAARNRGLREARADLVAFLDSDDEWMPEKLARQTAVFREASADLGLLYTGVEHVRSDGSRQVECSRDRGYVYREMLARNVVHGGGSNVMMRRNVVAVVGFFDEHLRAIEDYEYWLRIARFFRIDYVDEPLIRYFDPPSDERRSQAVQANLEAREWLFRRYAAEMRRAGVAHLFLLKSMRRALAGHQPDVVAARRLALRALCAAPASRQVYQGVIHAVRAGLQTRERSP